MKNFIIAPSILSADFARLGKEVDEVLAAGADWIHVDVMDNHFVPNLTMGPQVVKSLRNYGITAPLDVHLMITPVDRMLEPFAKAGATSISFHPEAVKNPRETIQKIRELGCNPGVVYNPNASLEGLEEMIELLDLVLIMSVYAGFGGQAFIPDTLEKVKQVRKIINQSKKDIRLEIDGGINLETIHSAKMAGADTFVMGSAIFGRGDYSELLKNIRKKLAD